MSVLLFLKKKRDNSNQKLIYCLNNIFGIGINNAKLICAALGYDKNIKLSNLLDKDLIKLDNIIALKYGFKINIELKNDKYKNITNLKEIKSYKGIRHQYHLPANGQNTHNNANTPLILWKKRS